MPALQAREVGFDSHTARYTFTPPWELSLSRGFAERDGGCVLDHRPVQPIRSLREFGLVRLHRGLSLADLRRSLLEWLDRCPQLRPEFVHHRCPCPVDRGGHLGPDLVVEPLGVCRLDLRQAVHQPSKLLVRHGPPI